MASDCPFCAPDAGRIFHAGDLVLGLWDGFPITEGHALLVPKRHVSSWFDATLDEQRELFAAVGVARAQIERDHEPGGYNIGINIGKAAGQTVPHLHLHVIPRYVGDTPDPRGGVRLVIPARGNYLDRGMGRTYAAADALAVAPASQLELDAPHHRALISGDQDPLFPHLRAHLDRADLVDIAVAFVVESGLRLVKPQLAALLERGGALRFLTGDYLGVTEPRSLLQLLDLQAEYPERTELRVFESAGGSFHPKSYILRGRNGGGVALVGSSNLTGPGLQHGLEWSYRAVPQRDAGGFNHVRTAFEELFRHPKTRPLDDGWVDRYSAGRDRLMTVPERRTAPPAETLLEPPNPHEVQQEALAALRATRAKGNRAGLVVLATGLGKTWLSAFDSDSPEFRRVLFVAHREEILKQSLDTYRRIRPEAHLGMYTGQEKAPTADVVFASIQTLSRVQHLRRFAPQTFDYIVMDEFHHADAPTYRRVLEYFEPTFLLGLTATPERTDGGDLLALCQENLVYRCDLGEGIARGLLSSFHYFGVPDDIDYSQIPWRSNRFDETALTEAVATKKRAENALEQHQARGGSRTLAFCCSIRHADFMAEFFNARGLRAAAVHSAPSSAPRAASLEKLAQGALSVIFAVDIFNEGVDLPQIDTVMMLRPTESRILWLQQLGRGLRKAEGKDHLAVIDYIGNHRTFLLKPQTLFELGPGDAAIERVLNLVQEGRAELPPGCEVTYDLEAIEILRSLLRAQTPGQDAVRFAYADFRERNGIRPTATEMYHEGYNPRVSRRQHGSWLGFVDAMGDLEPALRVYVERAGRAAGFLKVLETTPMTRSYKMLVIQAMLEAGQMPGRISLSDLSRGVRRIAARSTTLMGEIGVSLEDDDQLARMLERNPIDAWTGGKGTDGVAYLAYDGAQLSTAFDVPEDSVTAYGQLVRELTEWRLAEYLDRGAAEGQERGFVCRVSHANGAPIVFLPSGSARARVPQGWTTISADGREYKANFVKVALNVIRTPGSKENVLDEVLRGWFGPDAGLPGTSHRVVFEADAKGRLEMKPVASEASTSGAEIGRSYMRADIPPLFGLEFGTSRWNQGFVQADNQMFLLVTLEKSGKPKEHQYEDRFLSLSLFEWMSQNRHTQESPAGEAMKLHAQKGILVHLFVRRTSKLAGKAAPFVYCGEVEFEDWSGEKPITVRWRLGTPLQDHTAKLFLADEGARSTGA